MTVSDDPKTCYVAFNYEEFANQVFGVAISDENTASLNLGILNDGIRKLVANAGLPLSMRQSFGFPVSNLGDAYKTIRFTIGIEEEDLLRQYVALITLVNVKLSEVAAPTELADPGKRKLFIEGLTGSVADLTRIGKELQEALDK